MSNQILLFLSTLHNVATSMIIDTDYIDNWRWNKCRKFLLELFFLMF